jgi:hypothetical protein
VDSIALFHLSTIITAAVGGAIILTPLFALSIRFAFKPLLETYLRARQLPDGEVLAQQVRDLEAEVQVLQRQLQTVLEGEDFQRQLARSPKTTLQG